MSLYSKLQDLAAKHASHIYQHKKGGLSQMPCNCCAYYRGQRPNSCNHSPSYIVVDFDHQETIRALGGDDNEIATRIHWYLNNFPDFFDGSTLKH